MSKYPTAIVFTRFVTVMPRRNMNVLAPYHPRSNAATSQSGSAVAHLQRGLVEILETQKYPKDLG
jgi:hypothetical protein